MYRDWEERHKVIPVLGWHDHLYGISEKRNKLLELNSQTDWWIRIDGSE